MRRILAEITALEQRSARGDTVLIYFSGHGTSASAENNSYDLPYATGAWVPFDVDIGTLASAQRTLIIGRRDLVPRLKRLIRPAARWLWSPTAATRARSYAPSGKRTAGFAF